MLLQSPVGFEPTNSLPRSGSRFSRLRMGSVSHHHSSNSVLVLAGGFGPPKAQGAGDLQSPGIDHYPKLAYKNFSILTHTMEKSASQYNLFLVIIPFVEYNIIQFSLYSFTTLPIQDVGNSRHLRSCSLYLLLPNVILFQLIGQDSNLRRSCDKRLTVSPLLPLGYLPISSVVCIITNSKFVARALFITNRFRLSTRGYIFWPSR